MIKSLKKISISLIAIMMLVVGVGSITQVNAEEPKQEYIDVEVPAIWIPVDKDTNKILSYLNPMPTYPDMYPQAEAAKLVDDEYVITYRGAYSTGPGSYQAQHFSYTANLFFTNRFHRVVAQGRRERNYFDPEDSPFDEQVSGVRKLEYGDFIDEAVFDSDTGKYKGLHGFISDDGPNTIVYQEGETMKLYIATETEDTSLSEAIFGKDILDLVYGNDDEDLRDELYKNIKEVKFNDFDNGAAITTLDGENDQEGLRQRIDTIYLFKYVSDDSTEGEFIKDGSEYKDFATNSFDSLAHGKYEVVLPIYWGRNVPNYMSAPDVFSRDRYKYDDTIHFTMNLLADTYTVTFDSKGGSFVDPITDIEEGTTIALPENPNKDGYAFQGWFIENPTAENADFSLTETTKISKDITAYAKWEEIPVVAETYTVTFVAGANGSLKGDLVLADVLDGTAWSTLTVPTPVAEAGYKFKEWTPTFPETVEESVTYIASFEKEKIEATEDKEPVVPEKPEVPGTGIGTNVALYTSTLVASLGGLFIAMRKKRK